METRPWAGSQTSAEPLLLERFGASLAMHAVFGCERVRAFVICRRVISLNIGHFISRLGWWSHMTLL